MSFTRFDSRRRNLYQIVIYSQPPLTRLRRNNDSPFKNRAAFDLFAYFVIESGPDSLGDHRFLFVLKCVTLPTAAFYLS